ncbi:MAG TPA: terminase TerL endonuclease subunit [Terracidiphilus sp.]|nr:terminase TerL endonuclease subunit [Terracidiphilus sp.]
MRHEKGALQGQRFRLEDWQVFILCQIFGWVDRKTGIRKYREAFVLVPRGNGKSPLAAIIALWMTFFDGERGAESYCGATTLAQALEVFRPAKAMVEQVSAFASVGIIPAAKSIYQTSTRSRFVPVIGKAKYGGSVYCAILDEAHQLPDSQLYDALKTGCNKRPNSLFVTISTAGVDAVENPCRAKQRDVEKILDGTIDDERIFAIIYGVDPEIDWTSRDAVRMANPNLGVSNDAEAIFLDHDEAIRNPAKQNVFRAMHLNQWMTAASAWMNMAAWSKCYDETLTPESVKELLAWIGSDLASKLDLSATIRLHRKDIDGRPHYYCFARCYLPEARVNAPENQHYQKWARQGHLIATPGSSIDYAAIESDTLADITGYQVQELPYDARYADQWSQRVSDQSGITRVETPPSPAVLSPPMKELEAAIYDGRFHHDGHPVLTWCMSNVLANETSAGNYTMPSKEKPENKIDAAIALFIAMSRAMLAPAQPDNVTAADMFMVL